MNNDLFADNSWYFRNALIRANYRNVRKEVEPDMRFLNLFFRNLMMGENHELKNGFVAPLYPNNPKHPRQKYLLTVKGLAIFNSRCGVWHMEEIKGNPKSQEAYKTSKQV